MKTRMMPPTNPPARRYRRSGAVTAGLAAMICALTAFAADPGVLGRTGDDPISRALAPVNPPVDDGHANEESAEKAALLDAVLERMAKQIASEEAAASDKPSDDAPDYTLIDDFTDGMTLVNNNLEKQEAAFLPLYSDGESLYLEVPAHFEGHDFLLSSTMSAGPVLTGFQLGSALLQWRRNGDELQLIQPEIRYLASEGGANADNLQRTYTDRYLFSVPILAESHRGDMLIALDSVLIDHGDALVGDVGELNSRTVHLQKAKAFAENIEVSFTGAPSSRYMDGELVTLHYSISRLPEQDDFEMRPADQRVGYWVHARMDISRRDPLEQKFARSIERWHLEKADPALHVSPPKEPIIFYIEKSVPLRYRHYVRQGILSWNEAFREIGFDRAIEVRQQTETQYADIDPEDVRYNFVRWITTGGGFAIALHRTDPRTGRILDADVLIDDSWIDIWVDEYPLMIRQAWQQRMSARLAANPSLRPVIDRLDQRMREFGYPPLDTSPDRPAATLSMSERRAIIEQHLFEGDPGILGRKDRRRARCTYASRLGHYMGCARLAHVLVAPESAPDEPAALIDLQDALADLGLTIDDLPEEVVSNIRTRAAGSGHLDAPDPALALDASGEADLALSEEEGAAADPTLDGVPEQLIGDNLIALTAHEVGHVLGLRHNFAASTWKPVEAVLEYNDPEMEPPVASVMDYVGTFIAGPGEEQGLYNTVRVGPYDRWAIEYGYRPVDEPAELEAILARSAEPAHRYATDEDMYSIDPTAMTYDIGSDPAASRARQLRLLDSLRANLLEDLVEEGQSWSRIRSAYLQLWFDEVLGLWNSTGYVGGTIVSRDHNTPGARQPLENIDGATQRAVLQLLTDRVFSSDAYEMSRELLTHLQAEKWYQPAFSEADGTGAEEYSLHNAVNMLQFSILSDLLFSCSHRLYDQEMRTDPEADALTLPELHHTITDAIWSEFDGDPSASATSGSYTNLKPMVSALRRNLQREHAEQLIDLAFRVPGSMPTQRQPQIIAMSQLRGITDRLSAWEGAADALDDYTRIHISETRILIENALESTPTRRL